MARSAKNDPVERFRYKVVIIEDILASQGLNLLKAIKGEQVIQIGGGFSEVTLPKSTTGVITYRENIHATRFIKKPGLTKYDPIILKKGVTTDMSLYAWYNLVNNDAIGFSALAEIVKDLAVPPKYPVEFRKDLMITLLDRESNAVKSWVVLEAFPVHFKPGNDLDATSNEKLIAELGLEYEAWVEIAGDDLQALTDAADEAAISSSITAALGFSIAGGK